MPVELAETTLANGCRIPVYLDSFDRSAERAGRSHTTCERLRLIYIGGNSSTIETKAESDLPTIEQELEQKFRRLADQWRRETRYVSSLSKMSMHPAYQKIIGMGEEVVPLILHEMQETGGHWLWALHVITEEDPAPLNATFDEAVQAWLRWGRREGLIR